MPIKPPQPSEEERLKRLLEAVRNARPRNVSNQPDAKSSEEKLDLDSQAKEAHINGLRQNIAERKKYAHRSFCLVSIWLAVIAVIIVLQGFKSLGFALDDSIVLAMIGGTTTGVISIFVIVAKYLFPDPNPKNGRTNPVHHADAEQSGS